MTTNPISNNSNGSAANLTALFGLAQGTGAPYPTVASQVTDWTIGISYISAAALPQPLDLKVDSGGNVWVISNPGGLTEITPGGVPAFYSATFGASATSISASNPRNVALDTNNNVYIATSSSPYNEVKYVPGTASTAATVLTFLTPLNKSPYGITVDANNNVFMGLQSSSATVEVVEFPTGNFSLSSYITYPLATATPGTAGASGANTYVVPEYMAADTNGNVWFTGGSGTNPGAAVELTNINTGSCSAFPCTLTTSTTANTFVTSSGGGQGTPYGLAANAGGTMWVANSASGNNSVTAIAGAAGTNNNSPGTATNYAPAGGFSSPHYLATDGAGNVWVANKNTGTPPSGGTVSEISSTGTLMSETPISPSLAPNGFAHVGLASAEGIAVDPSGNVWVASFVSGTGGVEEIVGAAIPTVTPIALALKNGTINGKP
jgi:fibronectin-binding autotransporter adhesin